MNDQVMTKKFQMIVKIRSPKSDSLTRNDRQNTTHQRQGKLDLELLLTKPSCTHIYRV